MMGLGSGAGAAGLAALHGGVAGAAEASLLPPRGNIATVQLEGAPDISKEAAWQEKLAAGAS